MVTEHLERTTEELASVREAMAHAATERDWAFPVLALRWSERQHLAELELTRELLADLEGLKGMEGLEVLKGVETLESPHAQERQAGGDAPTPG